MEAEHVVRFSNIGGCRRHGCVCMGSIGFLPSGSLDVKEDRVRLWALFEGLLGEKTNEAASIPTPLSQQICCGLIFVNVLACPFAITMIYVVVYGVGWKAKVVFNYEEDIAKCTIKEQKIGQSFKRIQVSEEELVKLSHTLPPPEDIPISIMHSLLAKGDSMNFELGEDDIEASKLYPDFKFTTIDQLLDIFLIDPPKPARTAFE
ncbi:hypothetical protein CUMW_283750 [Citrus unshiu]|uniref:Uncharacterized protein n=1 Tax=Citrus unshiu TaxID=55188 RepID=A0A2H5MVB4_CITUN|nr:hypothetical protein CUMW_283750 [Citrus unshiu]